MKLGIFAKTFPGDDPLRVLNAVRASGFNHAHYNMSCSGLPSLPSRISDAIIAVIHSAVSASNISLCGMSATFNMIHPNEDERDRGFVALDQLAIAARKLGIPILTLCTGTRDPDDMWRHHPDNTSSEAWSDLMDGMQRAIAIAERHGVLLGIEPETANVVCSAQAAKTFIDDLRSDVVRIVLDPANLVEHVSAEDFRYAVDEAIDLLRPYIYMAHAKDKRADGTVVAAGSGVIDFEHFFRQLSRIDFKGSVITHGLQADAAAAACVSLTTAAQRAEVILQ
jgi:sugar phosphate isomerase/epimerase